MTDDSLFCGLRGLYHRTVEDVERRHGSLILDGNVNHGNKVRAVTRIASPDTLWHILRLGNRCLLVVLGHFLLQLLQHLWVGNRLWYGISLCLGYCCSLNSSLSFCLGSSLSLLSSTLGSLFSLFLCLRLTTALLRCGFLGSRCFSRCFDRRFCYRSGLSGRQFVAEELERLLFSNLMSVLYVKVFSFFTLDGIDAVSIFLTDTCTLTLGLVGDACSTILGCLVKDGIDDIL